MLFYTGFLTVNVVVTFTVFSTYIDTSERGLSMIDQLSLSLAICLYKLVWGNVVVNEIVSKLGFVWFDIQVRSSFKVLLLLFNTIIAPYVVNGAINSDCFGNAIIRPAQIISATTGATCYLLGYNTYVDTNYNASYITTSTLFSCEERSAIPSNVTIIGDYASSTPIAFYPPFQYNYQCSSSLISNFTFLLVIRFAMSGCCVPWVFFLLKKLQVWCMHRYGAGSWMFWACTKCLPVLHRPMDLTEMIPASTTPTATAAAAVDDDELRQRCRTVNGLILHDLLKQPILTPQTIRIRMIVELAMVLAFGVVFPPLAIVGLWSIFVDVRMSELILARLFALYEDIGTSEECPLQELIDVTNMKFAKFDEKLLRGISLSATISAAFWAVVLFDMLGDVTGTYGALWIALVMLTAPYWLHYMNRGSRRVWRWYRTVARDQKATLLTAPDGEGDGDGGLEAMDSDHDDDVGVYGGRADAGHRVDRRIDDEERGDRSASASSSSETRSRSESRSWSSWGIQLMTYPRRLLSVSRSHSRQVSSAAGAGDAGGGGVGGDPTHPALRRLTRDGWYTTDDGTSNSRHSDIEALAAVLSAPPQAAAAEAASPPPPPPPSSPKFPSSLPPASSSTAHSSGNSSGSNSTVDVQVRFLSLSSRVVLCCTCPLTPLCHCLCPLDRTPFKRR